MITKIPFLSDKQESPPPQQSATGNVPAMIPWELHQPGRAGDWVTKWPSGGIESLTPRRSQWRRLPPAPVRPSLDQDICRSRLPCWQHCLGWPGWLGSRLVVCQGRSSRHWATVNVCWRWGNLAWSQLQLQLLPEPLPGSGLAGSLVEWEKQSLVEPPSASLALLTKPGVFVPLTWETDHTLQRPELIKASIMISCLEPLELRE